MSKNVFAQTKEIKGVVNAYARVETINGNTVTLKTEASLLFPNPPNLPDTVLLIQMTGITQDDNRPTNINNAGKYEFNIVTGFNGCDVTLKFPVAANTFTTDEIVQMIYVPSYKDAVVVEKLSCEPWNWKDGTGGVLALMVDNTLRLNADIDVSGLGFMGGDKSVAYTGICDRNMPSEYFLHNYPATANDRAGNKGEGAVTTSYFNPGTSNDKIRGFGRNANGGGGGNGQWSGGGGGGNGNYGGVGGLQSCGHFAYDWKNVYLVPDKVPDGNNGFLIEYSKIEVPSKHVFMGGGGGAGTGTGTAGGNGGGIVIIVAQNLKFSQNTAIKANGESVTGAPQKAGAGGGGAGGSVMLSVKDYDDNNIKVELMGGNGGNVDAEQGDCKDMVNQNYSKGAGGGGSGGILFTTKAHNLIEWYGNSNRFKLENKDNNGKLENTSPDCTAASMSGNPGIYFGNFQIQLNGFFHNYIFDSEIAACIGEQEKEVKASEPKGGNGTYSYSWQMSPNGRDDWTEITKTQNLSYSFNESVFVRRVVSSGGIDDYSLPVQVTIYERLDNKIASSDEEDKYCGGQTLVIENVKVGGNGDNGNIQWKMYDGDSWQILDGEINEKLDMELPDVDETQTYRFLRVVTSSKGCISYSDTSKITVIPAIKGNTIAPYEQEICECDGIRIKGEEMIRGVGGNNTFEYQWQIKEHNDWKDISDATTEEFLPTPHLQDFGDSYYRRLIRAGNCVSTSNEVKATCNIFIPTGFSPDNDRINECFRILNIGKAESSELVILDRYNNVVFRSNSVHINSVEPDNCNGWWDGTGLNGKELPTGTYYYQLILNGNKQKPYNGYVVLKR